MTSGPTVRKASSGADWQAIRRLCRDTGKNGDPIEAEKRPAFAEYWIGPYERFYPEWGFVLESEGEILGYLVGCPDTEEMKRRLPPGGLRDGMAATESRFSAETLRALLGYPAHLHINLDARCRGRRWGDLLIERFQSGAARIHLFCKEGPVPFYRRVGFRELERSQGEPPLFAMVSGV